MIIGFAACGTTSFVKNLNKHLDINVHPEELWFFTEDAELRKLPHPGFSSNHLNLREYLSIFQKGKINGEKTPVYVLDHAAMKRIHELFPHLKIIICIRHPIQSLHSQYNHHVFMHQMKLAHCGPIDPDKISFTDMVLNDLKGLPIFIESKCYIKYLNENVFRFFDKNNVHIIIQERAWNDAVNSIKAIHRFLDADPCATGIEKSKRYDDNYKYASIDYNSKDYAKAILKLFSLYQPYNESLFKFLGGRIPEWTSFDKLYHKFIELGSR